MPVLPSHRRGPRLSPAQTPRLGERALRREARRIAGSMPLPRPFEMTAFLRAIEEERGRRIRLLPVPEDMLAGSDISGLWLRHEQMPLDLVVHRETTSAFHRQRIVFHELAHLWSNDLPADGGELVSLVPDLPPALVQRLVGHGAVRARRCYDSHEETRAETVANLLQLRAASGQFADDAALRHLAESLSHPVVGAWLGERL